MIFKYQHNSDNISPGIILDDNEGHDGKKLSKYNTSEREVILFPFSFVKIKSIDLESYNQETIEMEIINRTSYIEYKLK